MHFINRFTVFTKRILAHKMYLLMLVALVTLTVAYRLLPTKEQSTDIKVAIYCEESDAYFDAVMKKIETKNSIYTFYLAESEAALLADVKSSFAECGFVIPSGFFQCFINGTADESPICMYKTPSSTLSYSICETIFSSIYAIIAEDLMLYCTELDDYDDELLSLYRYYTSSDEIFQLMDVTDKQFDFETMVYRIPIPIFEITILLLLFAGLLGLLLYQKDKEKKIYLVFNNRALLQMKLLSICTFVLPIFATGLVCNIITYGSFSNVLLVVIAALFALVFPLLISLIIRKSTLLEKVLPLIMLLSIIGVFVKSTL